MARSPSWMAQKTGVICVNPSCICQTEARHVSAKFRLASRLPLRVYCAYCSHEILFGLVGCSTTGHYHLPDSRDLRKIRPDHMVFFRDVEHALANGYVAVGRAMLNEDPNGSPDNPDLPALLVD